MNNLKNYYNENWEQRISWWVSAQIVLAVAGLIIAAFLTVEHVRGTFPPCSIINGCHTVLGSKYAEVGSWPTASFGVAYYLLLIMLGAAYLLGDQQRWLQISLRLTIVGAAVSIYLVYLQLYVIRAICPYCMTSAVICFLLFGVDVVIWRRLRRVNPGNPVEA
jgi:uncharacterized membrane protein